MVIYGLLTETSIGALPGRHHSGAAHGHRLHGRDLGCDPAESHTRPSGLANTHAPEVPGAAQRLGTAALFLVVIGGLYVGIFSPTEAASIGAVGAFVLGLINRKSPRQLLATTSIDTVKTTAMIFTVLIGAILFNNFLVLASVPTLVSDWIGGLPLGKTAILIVIIGMYFVLGCLLDSLAMILLTIPIVFPIVKASGYDPVWFGIIMVMVVELGLITPPSG